MYYNPITNFRDSNGVDLGKKLITKDYLLSVYPSLVPQIGITPELWTWGSAGSGALGNGDTIATTYKSTPITTSAGGSNWKQVSAGDKGVTAAIKTDGTLWTWGSGTSGQLGNATILSVSTPVTTFLGGNNWKQVSTDISATAAIKTDGTLWLWGSGSNGTLGNAQITNRSTPVTTFLGGNNWKQVSIGSGRVLAIKTDGTLWCWGNGGQGELGNGVSGNRSTPITTFLGGNNWKQASSSGDASSYSAAVKTDGTLWTWGFRGFSLGIGNAGTINRSTPVTTFLGGTNWKQVSAGRGNMGAIKTDGTLWTWGGGTNGLLGNATILSRSTPVTTFLGGTNWKQISVGGEHVAAIKTDGTLWMWGYGTNGQLGNTQLSNRSTPITTFIGGTNWKQVATGYRYVTAIRSTDFI